ncbi:hypothetical protein [Zavarzinia sp. CC-PAN008]|uniref:hypothetical protein n=1 Tax=Zavarzinia sp. CC-PAN008 TaxID=3243332 RepID=UPI003F747267
MSWVEGLAAWPGAVLLRESGTAYLLVSAAHILGIALLVGAVVPLDLRLAGLWGRVPLPVLAPFLARCAALGLGLAALTGAWLFSVNPKAYIANPAFLWKLGLIAFAVANAGLQHGGSAWRAMLAGASPGLGVRVRAGASALAWLAVLVAGRWIGFL